MEAMEQKVVNLKDSVLGRDDGDPRIVGRGIRRLHLGEEALPRPDNSSPGG